MWWRPEPDEDQARALRAANGYDVRAEWVNALAQRVGLFLLAVLTFAMVVRTVVE